MSPAAGGPRLGPDPEQAREVVRRGYDLIGRGYLEWRGEDPAPARDLAPALDALPPGDEPSTSGAGQDDR